MCFWYNDGNWQDKQYNKIIKKFFKSVGVTILVGGNISRQTLHAECYLS